MSELHRRAGAALFPEDWLGAGLGEYGSTSEFSGAALVEDGD